MMEDEPRRRIFFIVTCETCYGPLDEEGLTGSEGESRVITASYNRDLINSAIQSHLNRHAYSPNGPRPPQIKIIEREVGYEEGTGSPQADLSEALNFLEPT